MIEFYQLKNRGKANYCFDYNPIDDNTIVGERVILYQCHGMGQNQVGSDCFYTGAKTPEKLAFYRKQLY